MDCNTGLTQPDDLKYWPSLGLEAQPRFSVQPVNRSLSWSKPPTVCMSCQNTQARHSRGSICTRCTTDGRMSQCVLDHEGQRRHKPNVKGPIITKDVLPSEARWPITSLRRSPSNGRAPVEIRAFQFYCENLMPFFTRANNATAPFWGSLVPQISQSEPAISHMLVACSSWQELTMGNAPENREGSFNTARQYHSKALKALCQPQSQPSTSVMLTACLLLIVREGCVESTGDLSDVWITHTLAGLNILREWKLNIARRSRLERDLLFNVIEPCFAQIQHVMTMFCPARTKVIIGQPEPTRPQLPEHFLNHDHLQDAFGEIYRWRRRIPEENPNDWTIGSDHFNDVKNLLQEWFRLLLLYLDNPSTDLHESRLAAILWSQYRLIYSALLYSVRNDSTGLRSYYPLVVDMSQPGKTVVVSGSPISTLEEFDVNLISPSRGQNAAGESSTLRFRPNGLWPILEMWSSCSSGSLNVLALYAPVTTTNNSIAFAGQDKHSVQSVLPTKAKPPKLAREAQQEPKKNNPAPFAFVNVADPNWRKKARSHVTRQQRRLNRAEGNKEIASEQRNASNPRPIAPKGFP